MAKKSPTAPDEAKSITAGALTAASGAGSTTAWAPFFPGAVNVSVWGTFSATVVLEKSYDGGTTAFVLETDLAGTDLSFTAERHIMIEEAESAVLYRFRCTAYTSGTVNVRASQG